MIMILLLTLLYLGVRVKQEYTSTGESSYDNWLKEPTDLEIVE